MAISTEHGDNLCTPRKMMQSDSQQQMFWCGPPTSGCRITYILKISNFDLDIKLLTPSMSRPFLRKEYKNTYKLINRLMLLQLILIIQII